MALDFLTLYIVILLNSLTVAVIWASVAYSYRSFVAARIWLGACLMTMTGGAVLALHGDGSGPILAAVVGNGLVIYGFCLFWIGIRYFYGETGGWIASAIITAISLTVLMIVFENGHGRNLVYATAQSIPMILGVIFLLQPKRRQLGAWIAAIAMMIGVAGHAVETAYNIALMNGVITREAYLFIETSVLLCVIFSGVLWNFGFAVMTIDRLRGEVAALAIEDELTGLPNRRRLMERISGEEARSHKTGRPFALMMIDLDNFKTLNDTYGHAAGDQALRHFANVLRRHARDNDLVARLAGDEFCLVLPETRDAIAGTIASDLTESIRRQPLHWRGHTIRLTASIGVSSWHRNAPDGDTLERADRALYLTKSQGRDGISLDGLLAPRPNRPNFNLVDASTGELPPAKRARTG
ncbi:MAG: GGDEF domain-containing protein [Rhizobiales bacterium]|nr:GGDEF domain-containing protein [Hyphomicrobiales bacterium]